MGLTIFSDGDPTYNFHFAKGCDRCECSNDSKENQVIFDEYGGGKAFFIQAEINEISVLAKKAK